MHLAPRPTPRLFRHLMLWATAFMVVAAWLDLRNTLPQLAASAAARLPLPRLGAWLAGPQAQEQAFMLLFAGFCALFVLLFRLRERAPAPPPGDMPADRLAAVRLFLQMLVAVLLDPWIEPGLVYLVAAELAFALPLKKALAGLLLQIVLNGLAVLAVWPGDAVTVVCNLPGLQPPLLWLLVGRAVENSAFQVFTFFIGYFARSEMLGRRKTEHLYDELVRLQDTLAETVRAAERSRISTQLHAVIHDRLEALDAQMALALTHSRGPVWEPVQTAHELTQRLWTEVHALGEAAGTAIDLRSALETLRRQIPSPRIVLDLGENLAGISSTLAHAIFRIVQEATSNAVRHSAAGVLRITASRCGEAIELRIVDDGQGMAASARHGSGLRGMRERVSEHGGRLAIEHPAQGGFGLHIWLPHPSEAA